MKDCEETQAYLMAAMQSFFWENDDINKENFIEEFLSCAESIAYDIGEEIYDEENNPTKERK